MEALNDFGLTDCKPMNTPAAPGTKLHKTVPTDDVSESGTFPYQSAVGILHWFSRTTHPQILYAAPNTMYHLTIPMLLLPSVYLGTYKVQKLKALSFDAVTARSH
jgi:hypothetical protein